MTDGQITYTAAFDSVKFSNGSRILSLPSSTDGSNLRGYTATCVCIDEAAFISHLGDIMQAINPTLSRDPDSELILTSTPAGQNGDFYELYQKARTDDSWYIQTTTIQDAISAGLKTDLDSLRSLCPDPDVFSQEYECRFLSEYGTLVDTKLIDWYDELPKGTPVNYLGMDIGSRNDRSAIVILRQIAGKLYLDDISMLDKTEYEKQLEILGGIHKRNNFAAGYIDQTGIGSAFAEFATKKISSKICGLSFTAANKTPMYEKLRSLIFEHNLLINRKLKPLIEDDFRNVQRVITEDGNVKYTAGRDRNGHSDATSGLVLAIKAATDRPPNFAMPLQYVRRSVF